MLKNKVVLLIIVIALIGILYYSLKGSGGYIGRINKDRDTYEQNMFKERDSPVANLTNFTGFKYFEPDAKYKFEADFKAISDSGESMILMTDSTQTKMKKAGEATFEIDETTITVSIFDEGSSYLLPFRDYTNGKETYGGGRFINIPKDALVGNKIEIDFNNAHNFYCAYNESFVCPIPPKENKINTEVKAGEKVYK